MLAFSVYLVYIFSLDQFANTVFVRTYNTDHKNPDTNLFLLRKSIPTNSSLTRRFNSDNAIHQGKETQNSRQVKSSDSKENPESL